MAMKSYYGQRVNLFSILALVSVVVIAGCIGGGGAGQRPLFSHGTDSLKIALDTEGRSTYDSLQPFTTTVTAENIGNFDIFNATARLQGYDGIVSTETPPALLSDEKVMSPPNMDRPQPDKKVAGGTSTIDWDVVAPFIPVDAPDREIILTGEVVYDTKSLATQRVVAATRTHVKNLEAKGEAVPVIPETDALNGPIAIDVEIPVPYVKVIQQRNEFPVRLHFFNDGTGTLLNREITKYDFLNRVVVKVPPGVGVDTSNCDLTSIGASDLGSEKTLVVDLNNNRQKLRLLEGGATRDLNCRLYVDSDYVTGYNTFDLSVLTYYTYVQGVSKRLLIKGTEEAPLQLNILDPTRANPDDWIKDTVHTVKFEAVYQNVPVRAGLTLADVTSDLGGTAMTENALVFNAGEDVWELSVVTPDMGTANALYDLTVNANYAGESGSDTQKNAVNYTSGL